MIFLPIYNSLIAYITLSGNDSANRKFDFSYQIIDQTIEIVELFKDLGVTFETKLCFSRHIDDIIGKANTAD